VTAESLIELMCAVPAYTEATFAFADGRTVQGLARDYPRPGRRWTVGGWEWFINAGLFERLDIESITFGGFTAPVEVSVST
jgi:hypothetical protein